MVTVAGMLGDYPPTGPVGFAAFAASLALPDIAEALRGAEPVADGDAFRFPASVRHRYEWLGAFPEGLLAIGDAVCSFNPVYGQGMTVAGIQAMALRGLLAEAAVPPAGRYFTEIARVIDVPWQTAVGADLAFPGVTGERTTEIQERNAYVSRLHAAAATDAALSEAFLRVIGMLDPPQALFRPELRRRVMNHPLSHPMPATSTA